MPSPRPNKAYLFIKAWYRSGVIPKLKSPETQDDKVRWLMLNYKDPLQSLLVDKVKVRKYVSNRIGDEYLKEVIGVNDSVEEIDFENLPQQFVLKANHGSGWNIICEDKAKLDIEILLEKSEPSIVVRLLKILDTSECSHFNGGVYEEIGIRLYP